MSLRFASAVATLLMATSPLVAIHAAPAFSQTQPASAELQSVTFVVENMTCALCPVTVKAAMEGVTGVRSVEIDFEARTATVTFDPSLATPTTIAAASANAGYPAVARS